MPINKNRKPFGPRITQEQCKKCDKPAVFFHTKCCNAHMEGIITEDGRKIVVCEKCNKYVGELKEE